MSDHVWVQENVDTYLAGELSTGERDKVEQHLADCDDCELAMSESRQIELMMAGLFADARPTPSLDERVIHAVRQLPARRSKLPPIWHIGAAAAAVLVIGMVGWVAQTLSTDASFPFAQQARDLEMKETKGQRQEHSTAPADVNRIVQELETELKARGDNGVLAAGYSEGKLKDLVDGLAVEKKKAQEEVHPPADNGKNHKLNELYKMRDYAQDHKEGGENKDKAIATMKSLEEQRKQKELDFDDRESVFRRPAPNTGPKPTRETGAKPGDGKDPGKLMKDLEIAFDKPPTSKLTMKIAEEPGKSKLFPLSPMGLPMPGQPAPVTPVFGPPPIPPGANPTVPTLPTAQPPKVTPPVGPGYFGDDKKAPYKKDPLGSKDEQSSANKGGQKGELPADPKTGDKGTGEKGQSKEDGNEKRPGESKPGGDQGPGNDKKPDDAAKPKPKAVDPPDAGRKIIRTGEMEFEIDSYYNAVETITNILRGEKKDGKVIHEGVPGGFIATSNSEKLANGKMRGSVVVRMPPEHLDTFVRDLRRELGKTGELKNQRIISLDVTKQYTDMESRLRAARTMEERLIQIIKIGKGEIKDLVAAERELGVWRTKIEEMEGEIRYYSNQVALSTLTITLAEKEITAPTSLVLTENVRMRIEVDNVAESHQACMDLVEEFKGVLTKSDLKLHPGGQLQSIIQAEIPSAKKKDFTKKLEKLGIVSDVQESTFQHTEGGAGKAVGLKQRKGDVRFDITMFNNANVRPRLSTDLKIATADVPGDYSKILEKIAKVGGQVRNANLNEQDKLNIHASIDFNVPTNEKPVIDKLLFEIGPALERINIRAPFSDLSTERKFGYTVTLRDFASIPPSKSAVEIIATTDVPGAYAKLQEAIAKIKGLVVDAKVNEQDKMNIHAQVDFSIPSEEVAAFEKVLKELGTSLSRTNVQAPMKQLTTARKFGYSLTLRDFASVPPKKVVIEVIAVQNVPVTYLEVLDAIAKSKGLLVDAKLNEQDKMNVNAQLDFTVMIEEKPTIDALLKKIGVNLSRTNIQAPMNSLSTPKKFGYVLVLRDFASVPPTKSVELKIATNDVPAGYAKLVQEINKAKGHVTMAKLHEQDKLNVYAQLVFSVPDDQKSAIDDVIKGMGARLSRNNAEAAANVLSTKEKFGYTVELIDFATIRPSQFSTVTIAASNVPGNYAKLLEAIKSAEGMIHDAKLNEQDKLNITGFIDFSVPTEKGKPIIEALLRDKSLEGQAIGAVLSRKNDQTPANILSTDTKYGYAVTLRDFANIPPRETFILQLAINDVPSSFREMQDAVAKAKGWIHVGMLKEDNKAKIEAQLDFDVPTEQMAAIEALVKKAGAVVTRTSEQVPVDRMATDQKVGYRVSLRSTASIPPREKTLIKFEVANVDDESSKLKELVLAGKGRVVDSTVDRLENGQVTAAIVFEVPFASQDTLLRQMKATTGKQPLSQRTTRDSKVPENELTTAHIIVTLTGGSPIVPSDEGIGAYMSSGLRLSYKVLAWVATILIVGLSFAVPVVIVLALVLGGMKAYAAFMGTGHHQPPVPALDTPAGDIKPTTDDDKAPPADAPKP